LLRACSETWSRLFLISNQVSSTLSKEKEASTPFVILRAVFLASLALEFSVQKG
jgi:hypothetical protein